MKVEMLVRRVVDGRVQVSVEMVDTYDPQGNSGGYLARQQSPRSSQKYSLEDSRSHRLSRRASR